MPVSNPICSSIITHILGRDIATGTRGEGQPPRPAMEASKRRMPDSTAANIGQAQCAGIVEVAAQTVGAMIAHQIAGEGCAPAVGCPRRWCRQ